MSKKNLAKQISENWELDDWSITKECFDKIIEILPFNSIILEIGSGHSTKILSNFYKMISIESNKEWMNKYNSKYFFVPIKMMNSNIFGNTKWLDKDILQNILDKIDYDMLIVDAGGDRVGIYDNIDMFKKNIPIIFDDTMCNSYKKCAELVANKLNKKCTTYNCKKNKKAIFWFDGKKYSLIN